MGCVAAPLAIRDPVKGVPPVTSTVGKATRIRLFSFDTPHMRAFHMAWIAFFLCFFAWFGIAPLMPVVRKELQLSAGAGRQHCDRVGRPSPSSPGSSSGGRATASGRGSRTAGCSCSARCR